jgi:hypothetical protein
VLSVEQEQVTIPEHMSFPPVFSEFMKFYVLCFADNCLYFCAILAIVLSDLHSQLVISSLINPFFYTQTYQYFPLHKNDKIKLTAFVQSKINHMAI